MYKMIEIVQSGFLDGVLGFLVHNNMKNLAKSAPPLHFNIHVPSSRNVLLFYTPSFFLLYYAPILAVNLT